MTKKKEPVHSFRLGRIKVKVWENETPKKEVWYNVEIIRLYKEGEQWKETTRFGRDDLPLVAKAADMAYTWIWDQESSPQLVNAADVDE